MAAGFRIRSIRSDQSIGDRLKRARTRKKVTVPEVEEATKIRAKFIEALESDDWTDIPSEVYGRGYLERYAQFLRLSSTELMRQFDRERHAYARTCQDAKVALSPQVKFRMPRFSVTPRHLLTALAMGVAAVGFGLVANQMVAFSASPALELAQAAEAAGAHGELVVTSSQYTVRGKTASGASVSVNGTQAMVDDSGSFESVVPLFSGLNSVVVVATAPNGKQSREITSVRLR